MSEEQQLIDRLVENYKAEQVRVAIQQITEKTPLERQEEWLYDLTVRVNEAESKRLKTLALIAANLILTVAVGYLSVVAIVLMNQKP